MWQAETAHCAAEEAEAAGQLARQVRYVLLQQHRTTQLQVAIPVSLLMSDLDALSIAQHGFDFASHHLYIKSCHRHMVMSTVSV